MLSDMLSKAVMGVTQRLNLLFRYINQAGEWSMWMLQTVTDADSLKSRIRGQILLAEMLQRYNIMVFRVPRAQSLHFSVFRSFQKSDFLYLWQIEEDVWAEEPLHVNISRRILRRGPGKAVAARAQRTLVPKSPRKVSSGLLKFEFG